MAEYPQTQYKFRLFDNVKRLDFSEIMEKTPGCVGIINTSYFALADLPGGIQYYDHQSALMIGGNWACAPLWHEHGPCIDKSGKMTLGTEKDAVCDYAVALPPAVIGGKPYNPDYYGKNGVSYSGLKADGTVVCLLSKKDDGMTSTEAVAAKKLTGMHTNGDVEEAMVAATDAQAEYADFLREITARRMAKVRAWKSRFKKSSF